MGISSAMKPIHDMRHMDYLMSRLVMKLDRNADIPIDMLDEILLRLCNSQPTSIATSVEMALYDDI